VALIVRWPGGGFRAGTTISPLMSNVDVLPTVLEAVGIPVPATVQGQSFLPLLRGDEHVSRNAVYAEKTFHSYYDPMRAIRTERHKYIRNFETTFLVEVPGDVQLGAIYRTELQRYVAATHPDVEIYDLAADPLEQDTRLWRWMEETGDPLPNGPVPSPAYRRSLGEWAG
jgi:arylsulfatase A-like enzyme